MNIRGDGFDRGQQRDPGACNPEGVGEVNGVLRNIAHRQKRGRDIDRGVAHQQRPRIGRHIKGKHMADPPLGADPAFLVQHGPHELAGIQAALHQRQNPALARQLDGLFRGLVAVFHIHHGIIADIDRMFLGEPVDPGLGPDQQRDDQAGLGGLRGALERILAAWMRHRDRHRFDGPGGVEQFPEPPALREAHIGQRHARALDLFHRRDDLRLALDHQPAVLVRTAAIKHHPLVGRVFTLGRDRHGQDIAEGHGPLEAQ